MAYDLLILRRGAAAAFSGKRDMLLLALMAASGALFAWTAAGEIADKAAALPLALKAVLVGLGGLAVANTVAARLGHLRAHSILARDALQGGPAVTHAGFWSAPPLLAALAVFARGPEPAVEIGALLAACGAGAAAALGSRALSRQLRHWIAQRRGGEPRAALPDLEVGTRRQRMARLLIARSGLRQVPAAVNVVLFAALGAALGLLVPFRASGPLVFVLPIMGLAAALLVGRALRQPPSLLRYLLFLGIMPTVAALVPLLLGAVLVAGFVIAAASIGAIPPAWLAGGAAAVLLFLGSIALLRAYHHAAKSRQAAALALQIDLALIAATALIAPPFAPALLAARLWMLHRAAATLRHSLQ
ncbi:MAG: hypothetical protein ACK4SZ_17280 [Allosphingosinicella sp.]|uniref:hypothetical protein n=1 Tax=Allosphingosinicella sp. TaxID=2823234 RepID=UPI00395AAFA4